PSYSGANPRQRSCLRSASRAARLSSGMENATSDHIPSHGWLAAPKEKIRRAPSSRIPAARELSRENVRRPVLDVISSPLRVSPLPPVVTEQGQQQPRRPLRGGAWRRPRLGRRGIRQLRRYGAAHPTRI